MATILSPILHPASGLWMLGKIENHVAKPLTREEVEQHIAEHALLRDREASTMKLLEHVEALGLDKARLDWLEANGHRISLSCWKGPGAESNPWTIHTDFENDTKIGEASTARETIDEARTAPV